AAVRCAQLPGRCAPVLVDLLPGRVVVAHGALTGAGGELLDEQLVGVAVAPLLARLVRADHRVVQLPKVLRRVAVRRVVAAADVAAGETEPQVDPDAAGGQALFAAVAA